MGRFGAFDPVKPLDAGKHLWSARKGTGPARYIVKFIEGPTVEMGSGPKVWALRTSAELQKGIAKAKKTGWAPILEMGDTTSGGAFYVTNLYPFSIQRLVEQRLEPTSGQIAKVLSQVVAASLAMSALYGRGHNNLKSTNVLITDSNLMRAAVFLTDPAPPGSPAAGDANADRRGMGRLIFELATGLPYQDYFWPVRTQKKWEALQPHGEKWLSWCNRLLAPADDPNALSVEQFGQELKPIVPTPSLSERLPIKAISVAAVVALAGAGAAIFFQSRKSLPPPAPAPVAVAQPAPAPVQPPPPPAEESIVVQPTAPPVATTPPPPPPVAITPAPTTLATAPPEVQHPAEDAQRLIDVREQAFDELATDLQNLAPASRPDLYADMKAGVANLNLPVLTEGSASKIEHMKTDAFNKIDKARKTSVAAALAKTKTMKFSVPEINRPYQAFLRGIGKVDPETALYTTALVTWALDHAQSSWPSTSPISPLVPKAGTDLYNATANQLVRQLIQASASSADPKTPAVAAADFDAKFAVLQTCARTVSEQFEAVNQAAGQLQSDAYPPSPDTWKALQSRLKAAGNPLPGWPAADVKTAKAQVDSVVAVLQSADASQLQQAASSGAGRAMLLAVLSRLPLSNADADTECKIFLDVTSRLGQTPSPVIAQLADLWTRRLTDQTDPDQADHLLMLARSMNLASVPQGKPSAMELSYFDARLADLQKQFAAAASDKQQADAVQTFLHQSQPICSGQWALDDASKQAINKMCVSLRLAQMPPPTGLPPADFARASADSDDLLYTPSFDASHPMRFKRLVNKTTGVPFYICTTEATVGWFSGMVDFQRKLLVIKHLMDLTAPAKLCGPSTWHFDVIHTRLEVNPDKSWFAYKNHRWDDDDSKYIPGPEGPTDLSPMQYVSPVAAMYIAELAGCRLPTVDEWQTAYDSGLRDSDENSSDGNWQALRDSIDSLHPRVTATPTWLKLKVELGIDDDAGQKLPFAGPVRDGNNDVLWFRDVPSDMRSFRDMGGNVAEWVLSETTTGVAPRLETIDPITILDEDGEHVITTQDDPTLATFYKHCMRIGLTSTSQRTDDPAKPALPADPAQNHHHQFYDVGFRMALDDPRAQAAPSLAAAVGALKPVEP